LLAKRRPEDWRVTWEIDDEAKARLIYVGEPRRYLEPPIRALRSEVGADGILRWVEDA
jgi:hypothetical protein